MSSPYCLDHKPLVDEVKEIKQEVSANREGIAYIRGKIDSVEGSLNLTRKELWKGFNVLKHEINGNKDKAKEIEEEDTSEIVLPEANSETLEIKKTVRSLDRFRWLIVGGAIVLGFTLLNLKSVIENIQWMASLVAGP